MCYHLIDFSQLLAATPDADGLRAWAEQACRETRKAHIAMWTFASTFTKEDARVFHSLVQEAIRRTENARGCELYNRNFKIRLQNIENFLNGALPAFPPELDEEEREIMTPAALRIKEEAEKALNGRSNDWRNLLTESEASKAPAPAAPEPKSATLQAKKVA